MKKINLNIDDIAILHNLYSSKSKLVADFKDREDFFLKHRYKMYIVFAEKRKLSTLPRTPYFHRQRAQIFESLYSSGLSSLKYIKEYRQRNSYKVCSLCGSPAAGTLDHFLPKDTYPEFSIFSKNLIPACKCNFSKNKNISMIYHPQFFDFIENRLYYIDFLIVNNSINYRGIKLNIKPSHPYYKLIESHLKNHILKCVDGFEDEMRIRLQSLYDTPKTYIFALDSVTISSKQQLKKIIHNQLKRENQKFQTPNSWDSLILASFLKKEVFNDFFLRVITI
ncbi:hypothetical protein [Acinetobacter indicus]|uniref:hypothetical protein n=1 Tax=Acinetobacter indicus TaxID=756892 RepID=UPI000CEB62DE|nr:hypothetical protein [Acinetobacter indicus]AVH14718.1 hypothetical protein CTZ23_10775 [Acinetobacter indicus]